MELWTDAHVPVASSASPIGEAPHALPVEGCEQRRCHPVGTQEQKLGGDVDLRQV